MSAVLVRLAEALQAVGTDDIKIYISACRLRLPNVFILTNGKTDKAVCISLPRAPNTSLLIFVCRKLGTGELKITEMFVCERQPSKARRNAFSAYVTRH